MTHTITVHRHTFNDTWTATLEDEKGTLLDSASGGSIYDAVHELAARIKVREDLAERRAD